MSIDQIFVSLGGITAIGGTFWFFLMRDQKVVEVKDEVDIIVNGGYKPEVISLPIGKTTKINFKRLDPSSCLEEIVLSDFKIKRYLPLKETVSVEITPQHSGEYVFSCGMNMFHGKIVVR